MNNKIKVGGNVTAGGNINVQQAKGDIIGSTTNQTAIGFKQEQDKAEFLRQVEELRSILRHIQAEVPKLSGLSQDAQEEIVAAVLQQVVALKKAKDEAEKLPSAPEAPAQKHKTLMDYLTTTESVLKQAKELGEQAAEWTIKLEPIFSKAWSLLTSARRLFGM